MRLSPRTVLAWILFVSVAVLATRIAGSHLHLCFDGSEPPVSFHSLDLSEHHGEDELEHNDQDVSLPNATLAKIVTVYLDALIVSTLTILIVPLLGASVLPPRRTSRLFLRLFLFFLRPPLRGPPHLLQI